MKVVFAGRMSRGPNSLQSPLSMAGDFIELVWNDWDDFGYTTLFQTFCRIGGVALRLGSIKILIDGHKSAYRPLAQLRQNGWDGVFPAPGLEYTSVPSEIEFYAQLISAIGGVNAEAVARNLHDASLLVNASADPVAVRLADSEGFGSSLVREQGASKAYQDVWRLFGGETLEVRSTRFRFQDVLGATATLELNFESDSPLPHDINVLIGPNGVGKSRVLHAMAKAWLHPREVTPGLGFDGATNFSQLIVVSYSPLENFPVDSYGANLLDPEAYRYFGFLGRPTTPDRPGEPNPFSLSTASSAPPDPEFSSVAPRLNAASSLVEALSDDQRYGGITDWPGKLKTIYSVLRLGVDFDQLAVAVNTEVTQPAPPPPQYRIMQVGTELLLAIGEQDLTVYDPLQVRSMIRPQLGVTFLKAGQPVGLSSGQKLFSYVVINVVGAIRRNSLLLIDEPELFLHPTLEIQFIDMLKDILASLSSKALLATHSEVTVREAPRDCVHVLRRTPTGIDLHSPPFQTFAGDIQRISSYVFEDRVATKPYEGWIRRQLATYGTAEALLAALGEDVNEELVLRIRLIAARTQ